MQKKKYNYQTKDRYIKYFSKLIVISVLKEIKSLSEDTILLKLSEDGSVLITIHDDFSLNYWSYFDINRKSVKKIKICPQCNSQIGSSKILCSLCTKKICYNCKIVV